MQEITRLRMQELSTDALAELERYWYGVAAELEAEGEDWSEAYRKANLYNDEILMRLNDEGAEGEEPSREEDDWPQPHPIAEKIYDLIFGR